MAATVSFRTHRDEQEAQEDGEILSQHDYDEREQRAPAATRRLPEESFGARYGRKRPRSPPMRPNVDEQHRRRQQFFHHDNNNNNLEGQRHDQSTCFQRSLPVRRERPYTDRYAPGMRDEWKINESKYHNMIHETKNLPSSNVRIENGDKERRGQRERTYAERSNHMDRRCCESEATPCREFRFGINGGADDRSRFVGSNHCRRSVERSFSPDCKPRIINRSNDERKWRRGSVEHPISEKYEMRGQDSGTSVLGMSSASHSTRSCSTSHAERGGMTRYNCSDRSWSRQSSFTEQQRKDVRVKEAGRRYHNPSIEHAMNRQHDLCRSNSFHSQQERSASRDQRCRGSVVDPLNSRTMPGGSASPSTRRYSSHFKELSTSRNGRCYRHEKQSGGKSHSDKGQALGCKMHHNSNLDVGKRRNSCGNGSSSIGRNAERFIQSCPSLPSSALAEWSPGITTESLLRTSESLKMQLLPPTKPRTSGSASPNKGATTEDPLPLNQADSKPPSLTSSDYSGKPFSDAANTAVTQRSNQFESSAFDSRTSSNHAEKPSNDAKNTTVNQGANHAQSSVLYSPTSTDNTEMPSNDAAIEAPQSSVFHCPTSSEQLEKPSINAAVTIVKQEANQSQRSVIQPISKTAVISGGRLSSKPSLSIPSSWLKPKIAKKEPIASKDAAAVKVAAAKPQMDKFKTVPRRNSRDDFGTENKRDVKDLVSPGGSKQLSRPKVEERPRQPDVASGKALEVHVSPAPFALMKTSVLRREEPGATPDLLDASFASPDRPSEDKSDSNYPTVVSEDDAVAMEFTQQRDHRVHLSAVAQHLSSRPIPYSESEKKCSGLESNEPEEWSSVHGETSSDESDTDDEELMQWAQKMFGVSPQVSRPTVCIESNGRGLEKEGRVQSLKLKLRMPGADGKSSKSGKEKIRERCFNVDADLWPLVAKVSDEEIRVAAEENRRRKEIAKPLTAAEVKAILADDDAAYAPSTWVRRSTRQPSRSALSAPKVRSLLEKLKSNDKDMIVLKMKKYLCDPDAPPAALDVVLDALEENTNCEALYIQNFNQGMRDEQVLHLLKILQLPTCRIWCLNIGETYNVTTKTWTKFAAGLRDTKVTHMYASEHTISTELKDEIRETIRLNRRKHDMHCNPNNLDTIILCTHCWWNPINTKALRPYLRNRGYEHMLNDKEQQGLRGSTSDAPA